MDAASASRPVPQRCPPHWLGRGFRGRDLVGWPEDRITGRHCDVLPVMEKLQRLPPEELVGGGLRRYLNAQSPMLHQDTDSQPGDARG